MDTGTGCPTIQRSWLITKSLKPFIAPFYLGLKRVTDKLALSPRKEAGMPSLIVTSQLENCTDAKDVCVWTILQEEAAAYAVREVAMSSLLHATILDQNDLGGALVNHLSNKLSTPDFSALKMQTVLSEAIASDDGLIGCVARDLEAVRERDPACQTYLQCFLYFKGFIGDDCSILQGVTLGGTGKSDEDRHPKIGNRVLIGANASVLGNIKIGDGAKIAAGSVVLKPVEANCTVAGVPAKPVGGPCCGNPASSMDQTL